MDVFEAIKERRSVRVFKTDPVPDEHLEQNLEAARYAPTAGNNQPWRFLVVRERDSLQKLQSKLEQWVKKQIEDRVAEPETQEEQIKAIVATLEKIFAAPVFIFIFVDAKLYPELVVYDGALAAENLMLAARALGYGTCFMTTFFPEDVVKKHFDIPQEFLRLICTVPVGHPVEWMPAPPKKYS